MAVNLKIVSQVVTSGTPGPAGKSAYQIAVDNGFQGTESEWLKELHPFKGWFDSVSELEEEHPAPSVGEYAYVKGATSSDPIKIYECSTEGSWFDSGRTVDTSTVQTFRSGEAVNDVDITDDSSDIEESSDKIPTAGAVADALGNVKFSTGEKVKNVGIDAEPVAGSENLVKSGGVEKIERKILTNTGLPLYENKTFLKNSTIFDSSNLPIGKKIRFDFSRGYVSVKDGNTIIIYIGTTSEPTITEYLIPDNCTSITAGSELVINEIRVIDINNNQELTENVNSLKDYVGYDVSVLKGIGLSGVGFFTQVGDCYYNSSDNKIHKCATYTSPTVFTDERIDPQESVIYIVGDTPYTYNGSTLVSKVANNSKEFIERFSKDEYEHEKNTHKIDSITPVTIPACSTYPIWEPVLSGNNYIANNDMYDTISPLTYNELLAEFFDKYLGYQKDGYIVYKNELGRTITDSASYPLYEYDFIPKKYNKIVMLSAGMNAEELTAIFGVCFFIKNLMEEHHSDDGLSYLYKNVRFKVLPVINVWGYQQAKMQYKTAEGININLNWDYNDSWANNGSTDPDSNFYKGTSPFSGQETKILKNWLSSNGKSAELWIDCHTGVGVQSSVSKLKTFYTFASPQSLQEEILKCQADIISYYENKGFSPTAANCGLGTAYPKTADAFGTYGVKGIMIEQYPNAPGYGGSGDTDQSLQNKDVDIANYVLMIRAYTLTALKKKTYSFSYEDICYMLYQWRLSTFGRDDINANFPLYTFFHGEPAWSYNRRGTELIPIVGGTDTVFIIPISDIGIVDCKFYTANASTNVSKDADGNIIYATLSGQTGFRTTFKKEDDSGMEYFGIDRTMVEIEINGVCYNHNYDYSHYHFDRNFNPTLSTTRLRVMSPYISVVLGEYVLSIKDGFNLVDIVAFDSVGESPIKVIPNDGLIVIPEGKSLIRATFGHSDNSPIHLIETDDIITSFYRINVD